MAHEITEWIVHYMMNIDDIWWKLMNIEIKEKGHNMKYDEQGSALNGM